MTSRRILYVINGFDPGGAEHGLLTLLQYQFFAGHDLKILAFCRGRGALADRIAAAVGPENVTIVSQSTELGLRDCLAGLSATWWQQWRWRPQVVVLSLKQANVIGRLVACCFPSARVVSFEHISRYRARRAEWIYEYLLWALSFRVDEVWADCRETHLDTSRYFVRRRRRQQIVTVFRADPEAPHKTRYVLHAPIRLAAAGRLVSRKNFQAAVHAVRVLRFRGHDVRLDIFGDGPEEAALRAYIEEGDLGQVVRLAGYQQDWCSQALDHDIFVNLSETEGFCIVVAEAMAAGLPVVATAVGGIREYGRDGESLLTLEAPDAAALVAGVERLVADDALREQIGRTARERMLAQYSPQAMRVRSQSVLDAAFSHEGVQHAHQ
jgi:glycosyltransferase involved in cell wall biosynthesis